MTWQGFRVRIGFRVKSRLASVSQVSTFRPQLPLEAQRESWRSRPHRDVTLFMFFRPVGRSTNSCVMCPIVFTFLLQVSFLRVVVLCIVNSEDTPTSMRHGFAVWRSDADVGAVNAVFAGNFLLTSSYKLANTSKTYNTLLLEGHGWGSCVFANVFWHLACVHVEVACFCVAELGRHLEIAL